MVSIDHERPQRQSCGCRWHFNAPQHHDVWLKKLKRPNEYAISSLVRENEEQSRCAVLPVDIIPMVDIHDFALDHVGDLPEDSLEIALALRYLAGRAMLPLKALQVDLVLSDTGSRG